MKEITCIYTEDSYLAFEIDSGPIYYVEQELIIPELEKLIKEIDCHICFGEE